MASVPADSVFECEPTAVAAAFLQNYIHQGVPQEDVLQARGHSLRYLGEDRTEFSYKRNENKSSNINYYYYSIYFKKWYERYNRKQQDVVLPYEKSHTIWDVGYTEVFSTDRFSNPSVLYYFHRLRS